MLALQYTPLHLRDQDKQDRRFDQPLLFSGFPTSLHHLQQQNTAVSHHHPRHHTYHHHYPASVLLQKPVFPECDLKQDLLIPSSKMMIHNTNNSSSSNHSKSNRPAAPIATPETPLHKIEGRIQNMTKDDCKKEKIVLLLTGSFCPIHLHHTDMLKGAKETMEKSKNVMILGGFISPSHDSYVGQKLSGEKLLLNSTKRAELCELQTRDSDWLDVDRWESNQSQFMNYSKVASRLQKFVEESCRLMLQNKIKTLVGSDPDPCETIRVVYVCGADFVLRTGAVNLNGGIAVVDRPVSFNRRSSFLLPSPGDAKPAPLTSQVIMQAENTAEELVRGKVVEERVIGKLNESYGDAWEEFLASKFWWVSARGSPDSEDISSTLIRERIEGNLNCDGLLHPAVSKRVVEWSQNAA